MNFKSKKWLFLFIIGIFIFSILMPVSQNNTIYAADEKYEAYFIAQDSFGFALYARPKGSQDLGTVVYCFNHKKVPPYLDDKAHEDNGLVAYTKVTGFSDTLKEKMSNPRIQDEDELEKKLLAVIANGYPMNHSGLQGTLSDGSFRKVTQIAIWYFTDSEGINSNQLANPYTSVLLSAEEETVVNNLIASTYDAPSNMKLDFYIADNLKYQNLLAAKITPVTIEKINMVFSKQDLNGVELEGAEIEIRNADDTETVIEWTSDGTAKTVPLDPGTYIFREKKAPTGFLKVDDITFKVNRHGDVTILKQKDTDQVTAEKNKLTVIDQADPVNPDPNNPVNPDPNNPVNPDPNNPVNPDPNNPVNPDPNNPVNPDPNNPVTPAPDNPVTPAPDNPVTPAPDEPVNPTPVDPVNPFPEEPVKLASIEPVNPTTDEPVNPIPKIPVNTVPVVPENIVTEVQVVNDENKRTVGTQAVKWKKELPKTGYTSDQYRLLGMLLISLTLILAYFTNRKRHNA